VVVNLVVSSYTTLEPLAAKSLTVGSVTVQTAIPCSAISFCVRVESLRLVFTAGYQMQGILVQQDASNYLRFEVYYDGVQPHLYSRPVSWGINRRCT